MNESELFQWYAVQLKCQNKATKISSLHQIDPSKCFTFFQIQKRDFNIFVSSVRDNCKNSQRARERRVKPLSKLLGTTVECHQTKCSLHWRLQSWNWYQSSHAMLCCSLTSSYLYPYSFNVLYDDDNMKSVHFTLNTMMMTTKIWEMLRFAMLLNVASCWWF